MRDSPAGLSAKVAGISWPVSEVFIPAASLYRSMG